MEKHAQALESIKAMDKPYITAAQVAPVIGMDPHWIRVRARQCPESLGFPVTMGGKDGHRVYIPRIPFIRFVEGM